MNAIKQIRKKYLKLLNEEHKLNKEPFELDINYLILKLQYLRDYYIIKKQTGSKISDIKIAAIIAALTEYYEYNTCITKYYNISNNYIEEKSKKISKEKVAIAYTKEKNQHWNNFWALVADNIQIWSEDNDNIF